MSEVLKFVTPDGGLRKINTKNLKASLGSILRSFQVKFRFERSVLGSAKRVQNEQA